MEAIISAMYDFVESVAGSRNARRFFPMFATIFQQMTSATGKHRGISENDQRARSVITVLRALGFEVSPIDEEKMLVVPPYWRTDVSIEEDVIEEVARTVGYDLVPEVPLGGKVPPSMVNPMRSLREEIRDLLAGAGMQETIAYSLVSRASLEEVLAAGEIDLYAEYTGTGLVTVLKRPIEPDANRVFDMVRTEYKEQFDLEWLEPFGFNNTYALTVRKSDARDKVWQTISDLATSADTLRAGFTAEFSERADGYPGVRKAYGFGFAKVHDLEPSLMYQAVANGEVDVICAFTTDGRIAAYDLQPLDDNRRFFPPYFAAPVIRSDFLQHHFEVRGVLARLAGVLDDKTMQRLNFEVDEKGRHPDEVARDFLRKQGLLNRN